jgi:hypothetical protein
MAMNFTKPATTDNYSTEFVPNIQANQTALAQWLDQTQVTITGTIPTYTKAYNRATGYIQEYNGSAWANLPMSITGNAGTATLAANASGDNFSTNSATTEGQLTVRKSSYNDVILYNNATTWGIKSAGAGGDAFTYNRGTATFTFNGNCTGNSATSSACTGNAATVTNGVYTSAVNQAIAGDKTFSGIIGNTGYIAVSRDAATAEIQAAVSVTRGTASNFPYYSLIRAGQVAYKIGILTSNNAFVIAQGGAGVDALITTALFTVDYSGNTTATGNVTAYSDKRLKKDLVKITSALDKIDQLTGYLYTRIDTGSRQSGLIAQDVQKVLPEVVDASGEYMTLSYGNMLGLIVEGIKELRQEIRGLK